MKREPKTPIGVERFYRFKIGHAFRFVYGAATPSAPCHWCGMPRVHPNHPTER